MLRDPIGSRKTRLGMTGALGDGSQSAVKNVPLAGAEVKPA